MEQDVTVAGGTADIETGQLLVIQRGEVLMEHDVWVAGGTADIETGQLLVIKRCLCHITFCNYKCLNTGLFPLLLSVTNLQSYID